MKKYILLMCIIQNMLQYYIKKNINVDLLKPKVMKLTYTWKTSFNINGTTIQFVLAIPLNKSFNEFKALNDKKCDILINTYDQLQLIVIDGIFLVGNKMLTFIDRKLLIIK
jgi:hypothetical protein